MGPSSVDVSCTDNEEEKKERAGPSRPVRCGMVLLCADHRRIPNLLPEDHCLMAKVTLGRLPNEMHNGKKHSTLRQREKDQFLAPERLLSSASCAI